jgi:hypothetical protein
MATDRQIAANRENAKKSTGPRTDPGKRRSRRNAFRHGLTAESVVTVLEDEAAYRKFEAIILRDYSPEMAIERALVVRLASLLWRLRRAVAIESGLFQIQGKIIRDRHLDNSHDDPSDPLKVFYDLLRSPNRGPAPNEQATDGEGMSQQDQMPRKSDPAELAVVFLRLGNFNSGMLELVGRYETRLWRQLAQTILILESIRPASPDYRTRRQLGSIRASQFSDWRWKDSP